MVKQYSATGETVLFGVNTAPPKGMQGFPPGRIKVRQRNNDFARAYVRTPDGIRQFVIKEIDGAWVPFCEQGRNIHIRG